MNRDGGLDRKRTDKRNNLDMKRSMVAVVSLASLLIGGVLIGSAASQQEPQALSSGRIGHRRVERVYRYSPPWESNCESDNCGVALLFDLPIKTPSTTERVDVVMVVTIDYKTSPQDHAEAGGGIFSTTDGDRLMGMRPRWTLATSSDTYNSTTLTWKRGELPAEGRRYAFRVDVPTREGSGDDMNFIKGRNVSVVVEMWPSGP
jgi:hypothetical protein